MCYKTHEHNLEAIRTSIRNSRFVAQIWLGKHWTLCANMQYTHTHLSLSLSLSLRIMHARGFEHVHVCDYN